MINLIKLELKKYTIKKNILHAFFCNIFILTFIISHYFFDESNDMNFVSNEIIASKMMRFVSVVFIIFASTLLVKYIIDEYRKNTITLLFTYPIARKKIILAKIILIYSFIVLSMIVSWLFIFLTFYLIQVITMTTVGVLDIGFVIEKLLQVTLLSFVNGIIALIPLQMGLVKRSGPTTIVGGVLIAVILFSFSSIPYIEPILVSFALLIVYNIVKRITVIDLTV